MQIFNAVCLKNKKPSHGKKMYLISIHRHQLPIFLKCISRTPIDK
jgi:hypothetical protein